MDFDPIWVEVTFPKGMFPAQIFEDGQPFSTIDSDSEDGGAVEMVAGSVKPRGRSADGTTSDEEDGEFTTVGTLSRSQIKVMASYLDAIITGVVNDHLDLISYYYWEAYLETNLIDKATLYPQGVPRKGRGEKGAALRLEADLRGETQMVLRYEVTGNYSFVNITDTVLPSPMEVRTATAVALNANVLYRELRRSEHPMLSKLELLTVDWADYGTDKSRTYKILGSVIFIMLLGLLGGIGYVYRKQRAGKQNRSAFIIEENDNASSWFSGDESSIRRLSSWREGGNTPRGKTKVSPSKTALSDMSQSYVSERDLNASSSVSIPHGDAEESIISSVAPAGPIGAARAKLNAFATRAFGRIVSYAGSEYGSSDIDMSREYYDDEPSVLPSELDEDAIIEDASSVGDMTKFTKFTYQDIGKRRDVDLLETCDPSAIDESAMSQEESNTSLPRAYQIDQPTVSSVGEGTVTAGEIGVVSTVEPSLLLSEPETMTEVGERGADLSLLVSEADVGERGADLSLLVSETEVGERGADLSLLVSEVDVNNLAVEQPPNKKATNKPNVNESPAKKPIKATFASLWHKKKKDTPSKKFRRDSSRQAKAAVVAENIQPKTNGAGTIDYDQASEVGSCRDHPYISVSDDMSVISALSIGGVSTIATGTVVRSTSIPTASKEANLMPAMEATAAAEDLHRSVALQEDAILEVDGEDSSNEGSKKSEEIDEGEKQSEPLLEDHPVADQEQTVPEVTKPEPIPHMLAQCASESDPESPLEEESPAPSASIVGEVATVEDPLSTEPSEKPVYPQELEEAEPSDSEGDNDNGESDAESDFPAEALDAKPIENEGDGSTLGYENIAPMEDDNTAVSVGDENKAETNAGEILDKSDDHSVPTVYEGEDDMPNKSIEQPFFAELAEAEPSRHAEPEPTPGPEAELAETEPSVHAEPEPTPGPRSVLTPQEATSPLTEEEADTIGATDDTPEEEPTSPLHFEIDANIKGALESKPSGESSEDELDGEIRSAVEECCSMISESDEDDAESASSSSSSSSLIHEIVPNASPKRSPKRMPEGGEVGDTNP